MELGFVSIGVSNPEALRALPYGWVEKIVNLRRPEEQLPTVKSVILMAMHAWDNKAFSFAIDPPNWLGYGMHPPEQQFDSYYFCTEIMRNKAWLMVEHLRKSGFESTIASGFPLKTAAVKCGLGCQGKNTLLITPQFGPRVRLISVLTPAQLDADEPFKEDLCGTCEKCLAACPTKALEPHKLKITRCMTYSVESPHSSDVPDDVRKLEKQFVVKPTPNSYMECTICADVCPIGKTKK
ncbi:MAG: 4Fe-4S double cluster binding domain-containing protein [Promethearchaeati archaeon SRVP18_Atabeyarchaeia-1]